MRELAKTLVVQSGTFLKRMNALIRSAKPKGPQDHRRQLEWMIAELFFG